MAEDYIHALGDKLYIGNADRLFSMVSPYITDSAYSRIILDLLHVRICDSHGIRILLNLQRKAAESGKPFILYRPDLILKETFGFMGLTRVFEIRDTIDT